MSIDHRAEAERKLAAVDDDSIAPLLEALVHATLAAAPALRELDELSAAVRRAELHQRGGGDLDRYITIPREYWSRIVYLVHGGAS
jgi:hypothetical protein